MLECYHISYEYFITTFGYRKLLLIGVCKFPILLKHTDTLILCYALLCTVGYLEEFPAKI